MDVINKTDNKYYYLEVIQSLKEFIREGGVLNIEGKVIKKLDENIIEKAKAKLKNKDSFIKFYKKVSGLVETWLEEPDNADVFKLLEIKNSYDKKSILNNNQITQEEKDKHIKEIDEYYIKHIEEWKSLLDYDWSKV